MEERTVKSERKYCRVSQLNFLKNLRRPNISGPVIVRVRELRPATKLADKGTAGTKGSDEKQGPIGAPELPRAIS